MLLIRSYRLATRLLTIYAYERYLGLTIGWHDNNLLIYYLLTLLSYSFRLVSKNVDVGPVSILLHVAHHTRCRGLVLYE